MTDDQGNVRHRMDGNGTYTETTQADPFGLTVAQSGSSANPYLSNAGSGYRSDGDGPADAAPLQKVGARYYDPQFGCFLTRDTDLSQKPYAYCAGDPVNFVDPTGHMPSIMPTTAETAAHDALMGQIGAISDGADPGSPINLANELRGKGTVNGSFNQTGPIITATLGVTAQMGRTTFTDTLTFIQSPTLTSVRDTFGVIYNFGPISGELDYSSGSHGSAPSGTLKVSAPFTF